MTNFIGFVASTLLLVGRFAGFSSQVSVDTWKIRESKTPTHLPNDFTDNNTKKEFETMLTLALSQMREQDQL